MPAMKILDASGDTVIHWTPADPSSLRHARKVFCQLHAQRRLAFAVQPGSRHGEQITQFEQAGDRDIVWVRAGQGG